VKLLLDENLPQQLRRELSGHDVYTVAFMRWSGIENGELLKRAAGSGFDAFITNDRGFQYEQSRELLPLAVVILVCSSNTIDAIRPFLSPLLALLDRLQPCTLYKVDLS
jgi:hypothetical protein